MAESKINTILPQAHTSTLLTSNSIEFATPAHFDDEDDEEEEVSKFFFFFPNNSQTKLLLI